MAFSMIFKSILLPVLLWLFCKFATKLVFFILKFVVGISVDFRVEGWRSLRNVVVKLKKGALESISISEIKLGLQLLSTTPKLKLLIHDLEIVTRASRKGTQKKRSRSSKKPSKKSSGGKLILVANIARFLSVTITKSAFRTPKAAVEINKLSLDISKDGGSKPNVTVKLNLVPILVFLDDTHGSSSHDTSIALTEKTSAPFNCEEFSVSCEFGLDRDVGVAVKNVDLKSGDVSLCLNEELISKKKSSADSFSQVEDAAKVSKESSTAEQPQKKAAAMSKYASMFPEKLSFTLPKLDMKFVHLGEGLQVENKIVGLQLKGSKSQSTEDVGESTRLDIQLELSEIHLLREAGISLLEILKLGVFSSVYIPIEPTSPVRSEVDVKLGGFQSNLILTRLTPWMRLHSLKKKKVVHREGSSTSGKPKSSGSKVAIMWTCTFNAPEMTVVIYDVKCSPLYHGCLLLFSVSANNKSSSSMSARMELGEFNLRMSDEKQECLKEVLYGVETNASSLIHVGKVSLNCGRKDVSSPEDAAKSNLALSVDVTGMVVYMTFRRIESLVAMAFSFKSLLKSVSTSGKKPTNTQVSKSSKPSGKGIQFIKFNLERCSLNFFGDVGLENAVVADPKRVNYGSQGGRILITVSADGTPRTANITSTASPELDKLNYAISLDVLKLSLSTNKEKQSVQVDLPKVTSTYQEHFVENKPATKVTLLDLQNAKFVRRSGGLKDISICSYISATDISVRWEPDMHIALVELGLRMKSLVQSHKAQEPSKEEATKTSEPKKETSTEALQLEKQHKKKENTFAIDIEMLNISAEAGDGVETTIHVHSIFTENARIGLLLEGFIVTLNDARLIRSSRMQISRIPNASGSLPNAVVGVTTWDWVIQALDVQICVPYRLELRAIDDSVEEMIRALKLVTAAKTKLMFPNKENKPKPKKPSSSKTGCVRLCVRKLNAELEEEPLQGWLDEHYHLLKHEARELAVRMDFLDELISRSQQSPSTAEQSDSTVESKFNFNGEEIHLQDTSAVQKLREEMYKQSFRSYYQACQNLEPSQGSGACRKGFQSGFRPSTARTSVLSLCATELDVSLTRIEGGDAGMIELLQKLDPVCRAHKIPFARLYGSNINLHAGSLVVRIRDYTCPLFAATSGKCEGRLVMAQQATCFQPQVRQNVYIGKWRKVSLLRSLSGTTPPMKTFSDLPLRFKKAEISYGVSFEPSFTDISYVFTVALRRANLSIRNPNPDPPPPKKEKSLPWWDEMRNYIHGNTSLYFDETRWNILATADPYEESDKLLVVSSYMEVLQSDGRVYVSVKDFKISVSSLESLTKYSNVKLPPGSSCNFLQAPDFSVEVTMEWGCDSGNPLNHYLFALPVEGVPREKIYDPFRSTALSLSWNVLLRPSCHSESDQECESLDSPKINVGPHDLAWLIKFWNINYLPPNKIRTFSRWPRFGVPRIPRSGNLSLDKVMTEFMFRIDATPTCIRYMSLEDDDPAKGLTIDLRRLKFEMYLGRGQKDFTFETIRDPLDLVYQCVDLQRPKVFFDKEDSTSVSQIIQLTRKASQSASMAQAGNDKNASFNRRKERHPDDGFLLSSDYFTIKKQSPRADPERLLAWQEAFRRDIEMADDRLESEDGSDNEDHERSELNDDDGCNAVIADNCQRIFVYGLKLLWNIENRDAVFSFVGGLTKGFEPSKPSPSRQYTQMKLLEEKSKAVEKSETSQDDNQTSTPSQPVNSSTPQNEGKSESQLQRSPSKDKVESANETAKPSNKEESEGDGIHHFMVNVIEPQFNLHSEDANGRFLLAALSGRVLARSFHSVLNIGSEVIEKTLGGGNVQNSESQPQMEWTRREFTVMLEHVQAHVAPTDVDLGAGVQWLPKIRKSSPKVKRTGALLERVFTPCDMYFRFTRHKAGSPDLKVKPLKELSFNSENITAAMTSRQFQVMTDVLTNLLLARAPKPQKVTLSYPVEDDDVEEEADEVVPYGVEEVELARIGLEQKERVLKLIHDDIRKLSLCNDVSGEVCSEKELEPWMVTGGKSLLVQKLKEELVSAKKSRKTAYASLRTALHTAAQIRLMEKEKNKSPSHAMRMYLKINKFAWSMLIDGKSFAEAEINDMIYDFDRDYKDVGVAKFTIKFFVIRNCLQSAKCDTLLAAWNPPPEWGKKVMLHVDARQGPPKEGHSPIELFQVEIYPLKIHLAETMYRMMWEYLFPEEEQDSHRRQEVWKVSTTAGLRRGKKGGSTALEVPVLTKDSHGSSKYADPSDGTKLRRTASFDKTWEESVAESVANELVMKVQSTSKNGPLASLELQDDASKNKSKDSKLVKSGKAVLEDKKLTKAATDEKRPRRLREFHNIKISQVELSVTYEGSRFAVSDLRLLMDTFHCVEFTGTWGRLFSRVKKHIIWGVLKSVTGMQVKKFKLGKDHSSQKESSGNVPSIELNLSDDEGGAGGKSEQALSWPKRPSDGAGDGFVTSVRGLFSSQRRKAKNFVLRTMRGDGENEILPGELSESEAEFSPFARQLSGSKARKLIRRHTKKFDPILQKGSSVDGEGDGDGESSMPSSPPDVTFESDSSSESSQHEEEKHE